MFSKRVLQGFYPRETRIDLKRDKVVYVRIIVLKFDLIVSVCSVLDVADNMLRILSNEISSVVEL